MDALLPLEEHLPLQGYGGIAEAPYNELEELLMAHEGVQVWVGLKYEIVIHVMFLFGCWLEDVE